MAMIVLQSSEGKQFKVDVQVAKMSGTIKTMLEDVGFDEDQNEEPIPLPNVKAAVLEKLIQWATQHKDDPSPPSTDDNQPKRTDDISPWDLEFLNVGQEVLFELMVAANYLDVQGLLDVACKTVANMIKGKSAEEIRQTFGIRNDLTREEEEEIKKENEWTDVKQ